MANIIQVHMDLVSARRRSTNGCIWSYRPSGMARTGRIQGLTLSFPATCPRMWFLRRIPPRRRTFRLELAASPRIRARMWWWMILSFRSGRASRALLRSWARCPAGPTLMHGLPARPMRCTRAPALRPAMTLPPTYPSAATTATRWRARRTTTSMCSPTPSTAHLATMRRSRRSMT